MLYINYMQAGGQTASIEEQVAALVKAAMSGDQQAQLQVSQIMLAALQGDSQAQQIAQMIQAIALQLQQGADTEGDAAPMSAKCGGKLLSKKKKCGGKVNKDQDGKPITRTWSNSNSSYSVTTEKKGGKAKKACGGIKLACGGKTKGENGLKIRKAGMGCPCRLKKQGGKLVEVDCNGNIIR